MNKAEMQKAVEEALMYYARYNRVDTSIEGWSESQFNTVMADLVRALE